MLRSPRLTRMKMDGEKRRNQVLAKESLQKREGGNHEWTRIPQRRRRNDQVPKCQKPRKHQISKRREKRSGEKKCHFAVQCKKPRYNRGLVTAVREMQDAKCVRGEGWLAGKM